MVTICICAALRMAVQATQPSKVHKSHKHEFGPETYDKVSDQYTKTCKTCSHSITFEKMWRQSNQKPYNLLQQFVEQWNYSSNIELELCTAIRVSVTFQILHYILLAVQCQQKRITEKYTITKNLNITVRQLPYPVSYYECAVVCQLITDVSYKTDRNQILMLRFGLTKTRLVSVRVFAWPRLKLESLSIIDYSSIV